VLAARWHGRLDVRLDEVPAPSAGPGEVVLRVERCGICGTDVEEYRDGPIVIPGDEPHPLTGRKPPITIGHEFTGTVRALGAGVGGLSVGDRVAVETCLACGVCSYCRSGRPALCRIWAAYGLQADGGLAEAVVVGADHCLPLPREIDDRAAALVEPVEVAVRAVRKAAVRPGDSAAVLGGGTIAQLVAQALRAAGARPVVIATSSALGTTVATDLGFDVVATQGDWAAEVAARTGDDGPEIVVECQGHPTSARDAIRLARKGGRIVLVGVVPGEQPVDLLDMTIGEKTVVGSVQHELDADLRPALELLRSGAIRVEPLITGEIALDRVVPDGLERLANDRRDLKVLVRAR
jgi:(R,R)-butanediol dehydrogenase/meso-butanediol dehydrogenase/diacetyl reductase